MRILHRPTVLSALIAALLVAVLPTTPALADDSIVVTGSGWGHGIGLSQYGMKGQADEGKTAEQIISYYYTGASVAQLSSAIPGSWMLGTEPLWVNLLEDQPKPVFVPRGGGLVFCQNEPDNLVLRQGDNNHWVEKLETTLGMGSPDNVYDGDTTNAVLAFQAANGLAQTGEVDWDDRAKLWPRDGAGENCLLRHDLIDGMAYTITAHSDGTCQLTWSPGGSCEGSIRNISPSARLELPAKHYPTDTCQTNCPQQFGHGTFRFRSGTWGSIHLIIQIGIEDYIAGIAEVPLSSSWKNESLRTQAIVARSYGVDRALARGPESGFDVSIMKDCWCHLYSTTQSQVYSGWNREIIAGGRWAAQAATTAGLIVKHPERSVVPTFYSSSSGGKTENNEEIWGGVALPYLRSVPDPWALDPNINPNASWTFTFTPAQIASKYGFSSVHRVVVIERNTSGSARTVLVSGLVAEQERSIQVPAGSFRFDMGLKSQYFSVDWAGAPPFPEGADLAVLHDPTSGVWTYRSRQGTLSTIYYGNPGDHAFMGDWNCDGVDTPGLYRRSDGFVYLRNSNTQGVADISFFFGNPGDLPIAGDFNGNGCDTVSIYRPSEARFFIINRLGENGGGLGSAEYSFLYGNHGDVPFMGDWNGDGIDTPGLRRNSNGFVYLRNSNTQGVADIAYFYGNAGDLVFAGDWNSDGIDTLGLYRPSNGWVYLRNTNDTGAAHIAYQLGGSGHKPVAGVR